MRRISKTKLISATVFAVTVALFISFFVHLSFNRNSSIYSPRYSPYYGRIINLVPNEKKDDTAPMGTRTVYSWLMDAHCETGDFLCFYVSNKDVKVTVGTKVVYILRSDNSDSPGQTVSSNWCIIPLQPEDAGKRFTVELTPLAAETFHKDVDFLVGSDYNIVLAQLRKDAPQLILGILCMALGLIIFLIQVYLQIFSGSSQLDILYMGVVSILLGLWRITDIRSAPLIFTENAGVLGHVSDGVLLLGGPALIQFASTRIREKHAGKLHTLAGAACVIALVVLGLQATGVVKTANLSTVSYVLLTIGSVALILASIFSKKGDPTNKSQFTWKLMPLLAIGIFLDFLKFYSQKSSDSLIFTTLFFLIFMAVTFIFSFRETSKMAYQDSRTGLFNKARWNELMHADTGLTEPAGILVLDLNGLKQVNDTLGHEAGDVMISAFADILKNALPSSCVICRWGGDEFAVWFPKVNKQKIEDYAKAIQHATQEYNSTDPQAQISFAVGTILSEEHPGKTRSELFHLADEQMYANKRKWYEDKRVKVPVKSKK